MAVGDVYKLDFYYHANQRQFITQFHYRETIEDTHPLVAASINAAWQIAILPKIRDFLSTETEVGAIKTRRIVGGKGPTSVGNFVDGYGLVGVDALVGNHGLRIQLAGSNHGRANRGAQVFSGCAEAETNGNVWSSDMLTTFVPPYLTALVTDLVGVAPSTGEWEFGYMSRAPLDPLDPPVAWPGVFIKPDSVSAQTIPQIIRSRQGTHQGALT